ncbi:MAG TPA: trypsin-like peptidase domain-containing protein [Solirubrobacterales bacterium]|jgi:hypothetical protein|nr:trypsin-like peptidase domain-containing protein [Solirubrobacterales bacterium]
MAAVVALLVALALPAAAVAAPVAHDLAPDAAGFWTPGRIQRALQVDSMEHQPLAGASETSPRNLKVLEPTSTADRTNGLILGVDPAFGPYSCSGTSLATPSGSIVLTAGHCVYDEGSFGTHLVFIPAYDHKARPFGTFRVERTYVPVPWRRGENSDFDLAAMQVAPNGLGTLSAAVGAKGWTSSRSRFSELQIFGYPGGAAEAEEMRTCATHGSGSDESENFRYGPPPLAADCNMASGSSGGGWLVDGGTLLDGVTSYHHFDNRLRHYSPYFGPQIDSFLRRLP